MGDILYLRLRSGDAERIEAFALALQESTGARVTKAEAARALLERGLRAVAAEQKPERRKANGHAKQR
jgi:hypothetical protein